MRRRIHVEILLRSLELSNHELAHAEVPELTDGAGVSLFFDHLVLLLQGFLLNVLLVAVLHPLDAVHVPEEGVASLVVVAGKGGGSGITGGGGEHIYVVRKQTLEHKKKDSLSNTGYKWISEAYLEH